MIKCLWHAQHKLKFTMFHAAVSVLARLCMLLHNVLLYCHYCSGKTCIQKNVPCLPLLLWRSKLYMFHQHLPLDISLKYMLFKYTRGSGLETSEKFPLVNVITIYTRGYFKNTVESNFSESGSCVLWWSNWFTNNHSCIKNVITKAVLQTVENDPPTWKYSFKNAGACCNWAKSCVWTSYRGLCTQVGLLSNMRIASSYSAMFCFMLIAAFINTTWGSCDLDYKLRPLDCPAYKRMYFIYKKLESIMTNDTETLYLMRQAFFPAIVSQFLETERVNTVRIRVCWVPNKTRPPPACNNLDSNNQSTSTETRCWNFRWSRSPVLNMIAVEQLLAFAPMLTSLIYSIDM